MTNSHTKYEIQPDRLFSRRLVQNCTPVSVVLEPTRTCVGGAFDQSSFAFFLGLHGWFHWLQYKCSFIKDYIRCLFTHAHRQISCYASFLLQKVIPLQKCCLALASRGEESNKSSSLPNGKSQHCRPQRPSSKIVRPLARMQCFEICHDGRHPRFVLRGATECLERLPCSVQCNVRRVSLLYLTYLHMLG